MKICWSIRDRYSYILYELYLVRSSSVWHGTGASAKKTLVKRNFGHLKIAKQRQQISQGLVGSC